MINQHMINSSAYKSAFRALLLCSTMCLPVPGYTTTLQGQLVNPEVVHKDWQLPENVIDTLELPKFSLAAENRADTPLPVYRLTNSTYFIFGNIATLNDDNRGLNGNAGFIVTDEGVLVIDTLGTPRLGQRLLATIRSITDKPVKYLIITHNHPDHAYGAAAIQTLANITVLAHPGIVEYNNSSTMAESVAYRRERLPEDMQAFALPQANKLVDTPPFAALRITLGGQRFDIYNTDRHHSYGDLVVHQHSENIIWVSDLVFNQRTTYMGDGSSEKILKAQTWLAEQFADAHLLGPGHGSPQTPPCPMLKGTRDYVERLRHEMRAAVENGVSLYEAVQNSRFEDWEDSRLYEENHRANASFVYREMEQEYFDNF